MLVVHRFQRDITIVEAKFEFCSQAWLSVWHSWTWIIANSLSGVIVPQRRKGLLCPRRGQKPSGVVLKPQVELEILGVMGNVEQISHEILQRTWLFESASCGLRTSEHGHLPVLPGWRLHSQSTALVGWLLVAFPDTSGSLMHSWAHGSSRHSRAFCKTKATLSCLIDWFRHAAKEKNRLNGPTTIYMQDGVMGSLRKNHSSI